MLKLQERSYAMQLYLEVTQPKKRLILRKKSFLEEAWNEYLKAWGNIIPSKKMNNFFTKSLAYVLIGVISIELLVYLFIYYFWIKP